MNFGARLAEERRRLGLKQGEFAHRAGTDSAKQSLYETGKRELRADYLARLTDIGVDVVYVLTGRRSEGGAMEEGVSRLASAYLIMPADMQAALLNLAETMQNQMSRPAGATLHSRSAGYRAADLSS